MSHASSRRDFFRLLAGETARRAAELTPLSGSVASPAITDPEPVEPAETTARVAAFGELLALAAECGLEGYSDELRSVAVTSMRFASASPRGEGRSFARGTPRLRSGMEWPRCESRELRHLAALDCADISAGIEVHAASLPASGRLFIFCDLDAPSPGVDGVRRVSVQFDPDPDDSVPDDAIPITVTGELVLPRAWSGTVEKLGLSFAEREAWQTLRMRLAEAQGVAGTDGAPQAAPIHRVTGYPDERRGDMALACEMRVRGIELGGGPPRSHPLARAMEAECAHWRLLLQLSSDDSLGWSWGDGKRLYLWLTSENLAAARFDRIEAFVQ